MNDIYLWSITSIAALVALNTIWRLIAERKRWLKEDLLEEDRAFAWRTVIFLVFPLLNFIDLRATIVACDLTGAYIRNWQYGLMWFHIQPLGLGSAWQAAAVYSAGALLQLLLALLLLPALLFRPHPFLATVVGYSATFTFALNLIIDPILSIVGMGSPRWQILYGIFPPEQKALFFAVHIAAAALYLVLMMSQRIRFLFARLSRPCASDELKKALCLYRSDPNNPQMACRVGLLYDRSGLRRRAGTQLKKLKATFPRSLYTSFLEAILAYRRRNYTAACAAFLLCSEFPGLDGALKASLLAAAGCSSFADEDIPRARQLCEQALEFDRSCLVARMVKVDALMREGKKEQAGEEILLAMREGLTLELEKKVPLDCEQVFQAIINLDCKDTTASQLKERELQSAGDRL